MEIERRRVRYRYNVQLSGSNELLQLAANQVLWFRQFGLFYVLNELFREV